MLCREVGIYLLTNTFFMNNIIMKESDQRELNQLIIIAVLSITLLVVFMFYVTVKPVA